MPAASSDAITLSLDDEMETMKLGRSLAAISRIGDVIALEGPLGAGKTVLARGFIRHFLGEEEETPSPTFTLCQPYAAEDRVIWHFDLYRLEHPEEALELGLEEAFAEGISLIEWPSRLGALLPRERLLVTLTPGQGETGRTATLSFGEHWAERLGGVFG